MSKIWEDSRFSDLIRDSRFKNLPIHKKQTKIDKRFKPMFDDKKFTSRQGVDKYGRKINNTTNNDLRKFYDLNSDDDSDQEAKKEADLEEKAIKENIEHDCDILSNDGIILDTEIKNKLIADVDFARGEGKILSDSSSDEDTSDEEENYIEHEFWGEIEKDVEEIENSTKRLAFCNMNWEQVKACDVMVLCHSFLPLGGVILSVKILVSDFGKNCIKEEETKGPLDLINSGKENRRFRKLKVIENDESEDQGGSYHMEKLRQYEINKLKYYYAIVECDSKETAEKIYIECDGLEYESTSTKLDLRFIPDDMIFEENDIKDYCTDLPSNMSNYKPYLQPVTALQQAKVRVTWDETTIERKEIFEKLSSGKFDEVNTNQLKKFINCSENEEEDSENDNLTTKCNQGISEYECNKDSIAKYKQLLESISEKEKQKEKLKNKFEMEYSWEINSADQVENSKSTVSKTNSDNGFNSDDIPSDIDLNDPYFAEEFGKIKQKKDKKKKEKRKDDELLNESTKELKLLLDDYDDTNDYKVSRKSKYKKGKSNTSAKDLGTKNTAENSNSGDNFQVNVNDKRFENIYIKPLYSIDPNNPRFKRTTGMESLIHEKIKRRNGKEL